MRRQGILRSLLARGGLFLRSQDGFPISFVRANDNRKQLLAGKAALLEAKLKAKEDDSSTQTLLTRRVVTCWFIRRRGAAAVSKPQPVP